jgi:carbon-monoxide dehydrogenase large subunit
MMTDEQGRGGLVDAELALDADYKFLGLRTHTKVPIGAYFTSDRNIVCTIGGLASFAGVYRTPAIHARVTGVLANIMTNAFYRGGAKPEPCHVIEVMVDQAARELGIDAADLRRRNMVSREDMPFRSALGAFYDCGDFPKNLEDCLVLGGYEVFEGRREEALKRGKYRGIGMSNTVAGVAHTNFEHAEVRFDNSGGITLLCGAMDHGQGHQTTFRQVLADKLGIDADRIQYRFGDTDKVTTGVGTYNARSAALAGSAVVLAAEKIIEKGKRIAAHMLEAAESDIGYADGQFSIAGTDRSVDLSDIAKTAFQKPKLPADIEPGFYEHGDFGSDAGAVYPNGAHLAEVEIDAETGKVKLVSYCCVNEAGTILNPLLFNGQVHGGIAQGAGQILMEDVNYDEENGQLLSGSFMDYVMPRADDFCHFTLEANELPTLHNPLGTKGIGEAGTVGSMPSVMNAINNALHHIGAPQVEMSTSAEKVWRAIQSACPTG